jgi:hypothetical protein
MKSVASIADETAISFRQLDHWIVKGYLKATSDGEQTGTGHRRYLSAKEQIIFESMAALVLAGVRPEVAALIARRGAPGGSEAFSSLVGALRMVKENYSGQVAGG